MMGKIEEWTKIEHDQALKAMVLLLDTGVVFEKEGE